MKNTNLYRNFEKVTSLNPSGQRSNINIGYCYGYEHTVFFRKFLDAWVEYISFYLSKVEKYSTQYADLLSIREFTLNEFRFAKNSALPEDKYNRAAVMDILYIDDAVEREKFRFSIDESLTVEEQYKETIIKHIKLENPKLNTALLQTKIPLNLSIEAFKQHAHIVGQTGSGKTELLKTISYELIRTSHRNRDKSIVILDPHGNLATDVLKFVMNKGMGLDRLIYLDCDIRATSKTVLGKEIIKDKVNFHFNPFEIKGFNDAEISGYAETLSQTLFDLVKSDDSPLMQTVLESCIEVLVRLPNSTLNDLLRFMDDENNADLVAFGGSIPNKIRAEFIRKNFNNKSKLASTKNAVYMRLQKLLGNITFSSIVSSTSTIDLESAINSGKVVIVNLNKSAMGEEASSVLGKFIVSQIATYSFRRAKLSKNKRKDTFLLIDEFQNFVIPAVETILAESRKFNLYMILAHQQIGQNMSVQMKHAISGNTALKFASENDSYTLEQMCSQMKGLEPSMFSRLPQYSFWVNQKFNKKAGTFICRVPSLLVDTRSKYYMRSVEYAALFKHIVLRSGIYKKKEVMNKSTLSSPVVPDIVIHTKKTSSPSPSDTPLRNPFTE